MENKKLTNFKNSKTIVNKEKAKGKKVVFTNGCFDILHAGHVIYLTRARSFGDFLVLGLNSDNSIRQIKGKNRPIVEQSQRALVLAALDCIDCIVIFDEKDPEILIREIVPDILVKGADWDEDQIIGADFVKNKGGIIKRVIFEEDISTSKIIDKIGRLFYAK